MKRTTLILEEGCLKGVRELAKRQEQTLSAVVNELLAEGLQRRTRRRSKRVRLPTFSMGRPRVNLADRNALEALMDS